VLENRLAARSLVQQRDNPAEYGASGPDRKQAAESERDYAENERHNQKSSARCIGH